MPRGPSVDVDSVDTGSVPVSVGVGEALAFEEALRGEGDGGGLASLAGSSSSDFFLDGVGSASSGAGDDFDVRFFAGVEGFGLVEAFGVDFGFGVTVEEAAGFGVLFRDLEVPDFFVVCAPAAIKSRPRKRDKNVRALRVMKLRNNQNLSWFDSILAAQLDVVCIKNIRRARLRPVVFQRDGAEGLAGLDHMPFSARRER